LAAAVAVTVAVNLASLPVALLRSQWRLMLQRRTHWPGTDLILPAHRRGKLIFTEACPRTGSKWTSTRDVTRAAW
jgi:hypothetical protein